jgi:hypothetical protein
VADVTEAYAHKVFSLKAQNMLNDTLAATELKKEASRRRIDTIRKFQNKLLAGGMV